MNITTIGLDLAKNVFQVHGVNERGQAVLKKQLKRSQIMVFFANLPPDVADAEAICEAVGRPNMRFVPIKNVEQQAVLSLHRARHAFVKARTAQANQIRGLLAEFGMIIPKGIAHIRTHLPEILEDASNELPGEFRSLRHRLAQHLMELGRQANEMGAQIEAWHRSNELSRKLTAIPGIGPISASALVASVGDARTFSSGRQLAAWLGLVPRQSSSGGKNVLLGMSKRGDAYLRTLLIHGARAVISRVRQKQNRDGWLLKLIERRNCNVAAVALANKNARVVWALLAHDRQFHADYAAA
jgi:transposase